MRPRIVACIVAAVMLLTASTARADWFDDFDGGFNYQWDDDNMTGLGAKSPTFSFSVVNDVLQVADSTPVATGGAVIGLGYVNVDYTDGMVYGTLNPNNESNMNQLLGLFVRGAGDNAYVLAVDYATGGAAIIENSAGGQGYLATGAVPGFQNTDSLYLELSAVGTSLAGRIYSELGGSLLASLDATDDSFSAGVAGVAVQVGAGNYTVPLRGTFDNVGFATPEPASLVLLGSGGICALGCWWRKRRRAKA